MTESSQDVQTVSRGHFLRRFGLGVAAVAGGAAAGAGTAAEASSGKA